MVLKLGGSLITDKSKPYKLRTKVLNSVSTEIKNCIEEHLIDRLVVVHGVGSYGHPPVIQYKLYKGFIDSTQLLPMSMTQKKVNELREAVTVSLQKQELPVNLLHVSSMSVASQGQLTSIQLDPVMGFLKIGMVPLLGGDLVYDLKMGFSVCSGDQVAVLLARELKATDLIFATDVSGIYNKEPKTNPDAKLIPEIKLSQMDSMLALASETGDASGAMKGKILSIKSLGEAINNGLNVGIISMMKSGSLKNFLRGESLEATRFTP